MTIYQDKGIPDYWVVVEPSGTAWLVPAVNKGWERRIPYFVPEPYRSARLERQPDRCLALLGIPEGGGHSVAVLLKAAREKAGLSCEDLAEQAGVSRATVYAIESGSDPKWSTLCLLAGVLNVPTDYFRYGKANDAES